MLRALLSGFLAVAMLLAAGCSDPSDGAAPTSDDGVRIGSFDFAESALLAELYAQAIEAAGIPVSRLGRIGPREIVAPALELDRVDLVPEYLGSALAFWGSQPGESDADSAHEALSEILDPRGLMVLAPSPAQDQNVFVVTDDVATELDLEDLSDLSTVAGSMRFGGPAECPERPLCLVGLEEVYGIEFAEFIPQRSLTFTAEALRRNEIDVGLLFSTAPELTDFALHLLVDDRGLQPPENIVPVVRADAIERWGSAVEEVVDRVSTRLTTIDLRLLNARVSNGEPLNELVREWLSENLVSDPE